jgi:hypothetical protein
MIFTVKIRVSTLLSLDIALETKGTKLFSILRAHFNRHFIFPQLTSLFNTNYVTLTT